MLIRFFHIAVILCFYATNGIGQNLVRNGSFEDKTECIINWYQIDNSIYWNKLSGGGGGGSPDHLMECNNTIPTNPRGYQLAKTGNSIGFIGVYSPANALHKREYFYQELESELIVGEEYFVSLFVSAVDNFQYGCDGIGVYFSEEPIFWTTHNYIPFTPQFENTPGNVITDTTNWTKISGSFIATGNEKFFTIGNFRNNSNSQIIEINPTSVNQGYAGFFIDDISIIKVRPIEAETSIYLCGSDTTIGDNIEDFASYNWSPITGLNCDTCFQTIASPSETTIYTLTKITDYDTSSLDITVYVDQDYCDYLGGYQEFQLYPNPNNGTFTIDYSLGEESNNILYIYNSIGQIVKTMELQGGFQQTQTVELSQLSAGLYTYKLWVNGNALQTEKMVLVK